MPSTATVSILHHSLYPIALHLFLPTIQHSYTMEGIFGDFCITCDAQTNGSHFCSQACRLQDLACYTHCEPTSPSYYTIPATSQRSGFSLPPAYDFSLHRSSSGTSLSTSSSSQPATIQAQPTKSSKLTEEARNSLRDYVGSFDQTRTIRRRVSMQSNQSN